MRSLAHLARRAANEREAGRRAEPELRRRDAALRRRLVEAMDGANRSPLLWAVQRLWRRAAVGGLALAVVALATFWLTRSPALDYAVAGAPEVAGYVRAEGRPATLTFDDGTELELGPGASGRVSDVRSNGARFVLEDGAVDARVTRRAGAAWSIHAGPWEVRVTGTAFGVTWDARGSELRIAMREGSVVVLGPGAEGGIGLRAGQSLVAGDDGAIQVAASDAVADPVRVGEPPVPAPSPTSEVAPAPAEAPAGVLSAPASASAMVDVARPWPVRVAAGDYDGVLGDAESQGVDSVLASASASDLSALADAARYRGRSGLATHALQSLRDRFAGSPAAVNGAFLLGRMADDAGSSAAALRWYDAHIAEGGAFAAEALGRKMLAVRRTSGDAAAAPVARAYLASYPGGAHAAIARTLAEDPSTARPPAPTPVLPRDPGAMPSAP